MLRFYKEQKMLIKNAKLVDETVQDILIKDGVIEAVGKGLSDKEVIDIGENYLLPLLVDLNVQLTQFDKLDKDALKGGVGAVALIPKPCICDELSLEFVKNSNTLVDIYPLIGALKEEDRLSEIAILLKKGGLSIYTTSDINPYLLARVFEYAKMYSVPLHIEPSNKVFRDVGVMNEGEVSFKLGLGGISKLEEWAEVAKVIQYSQYYEVPVIFKAISTLKSLELISNCKFCFAEVSIHHLLLDDTACYGYNTLAKLSPPLREKEESLLSSLEKIDLLTSLHSPKSTVSKNLSFNEASFGIDSLSFYLPLLYTFLVEELNIPFSTVLNLASLAPAKFLNKRMGKVKEGYLAELVVFDPNSEFTLTTDSLYEGIIFRGTVRGVIKGGKWHSF